MNSSTGKLIGFGLLTLFFRQIPTEAQSLFVVNNQAHDILCEPSGIALSEDDPKSVLDASCTVAATLYSPSADRSTCRSLDVPHRWNARINADTLVRPVEPSHSNEHIRWVPAIMQSLLYTGVMHTFDVTTEAGTRDTLNGHWFRNYIDSVAALRGWSDSDTFMAPYVGHPLEGSIFGYILRQNDPK